MRIRAGTVVLVLILLGSIYIERGVLRDKWHSWNQPDLPHAEPYVAHLPSVIVASSTKIHPVVDIRVSSTTPIPPGSVTLSGSSIDPFVGTDPLPERVNLAIPFLSQAPKQNWDMPYQEACEEASMLMVDAFYRGKVGKFTSEEGDRAILDLVSFEERRGKTADLTAAEVAEIAKAKWDYDVVVTSTVTPELVKRALANGYPVMLPADGKRLENPNFRNGGPPYHMLVIKGYIGNQTWITNDPGTRLGADFTYRYAHLLTVAHDWNGGDVPHGQPVLIVLVPRVH